ncbi:MAG: hypothetical protein ACPGSD_09490 [Flavobacteriales bacterium]
MRLKFLEIDRILSKNELIKRGNELTKHLKHRISERSVLTTEESLKIDQFEKDILKRNVLRLESIRTPFEESTPIKFDLVFDYENLHVIEHCNLTVLHILFRRNNYLSQLPLGHHCEVFIECEDITPELFDKLPMDTDDGSSSIGVCNKTDWPSIKAEFEESRKNYQKWKQENL